MIQRIRPRCSVYRHTLAWRSLAQVTVLAVSATSHGVLTADELPVEQVEAAQELIRSMLEARQEVVTGDIQISGGMFISDGSRTLINGDVDGQYCFDNSTGRYRYESSEPCNVVVTKPGDRSMPPKGSVNQFQVPFKCCRTEDYYASWTRSSENSFHNINLQPTGADTRDTTARCGRRPIDFLAVGMLGFFEFQQGKRVIDAYMPFLWKEVRAFEEENTRATLRLVDDVAEYTLIIDTELLAPLSLVQESLTDSAVFQSDTEWELVDDVVVPNRYRTEIVLPEIENTVYDLKLEWSRINEEFDPEEFEYTSFTGVPGGYIDVFDRRGSDVVHVGVWEADGHVELPAEPLIANPIPVEVRKPDENRWWIPLLICNVVVIVLLASVWWYERHRRLRLQ